jgi:hypothetical protein
MRKNQLKTKPWIDKEFLELNWIKAGRSLRELSDMLNVDNRWLESRVQRVGVRKGTNRQYELNTKKLFDITDPIVSYLAGLTATDGYVPERVNKIEIGLTGESEHELLIQLNEYFENTYPIYNYKENEFRAVFSADGIKDFFKKNFNIPEGPKTFDVATPETFFNEDCAKMYLRGCIDGDGGVGIDQQAPQYGTIRLVTGSELLIMGSIEIIARHTNIRLEKYYQSKASSNSKYPGFECRGWRATAILEWMYSVYPEFGLKRKRDKFYASKFPQERPA